jgi:putative oxidoreductase
MMTLERFGPAAARIAIAPIFVVSGIGKLVEPARVAGYMASKGLPSGALLAVAIGGFEIAGGIFLALGARARLAALVLAAYLVLVTLIFHNPAGLAGMAAQLETLQMLKNVAILGGLVSVVTHGAGPLSVDARRPSQRTA